VRLIRLPYPVFTMLIELIKVSSEPSDNEDSITMEDVKLRKIVGS